MNSLALRLVSGCIARLSEDQLMSILKKLLGRGGDETKQRVRVCIECGMPVDDHREWCAILRTRLEMERKSADVMPPRA
jgi:hypothetical protein